MSRYLQDDHRMLTWYASQVKRSTGRKLEKRSEDKCYVQGCKTIRSHLGLRSIKSETHENFQIIQDAAALLCHIRKGFRIWSRYYQTISALMVSNESACASRLCWNFAVLTFVCILYNQSLRLSRRIGRSMWTKRGSDMDQQVIHVTRCGWRSLWECSNQTRPSRRYHHSHKSRSPITCFMDLDGRDKAVFCIWNSIRSADHIMIIMPGIILSRAVS